MTCETFACLALTRPSNFCSLACLNEDNRPLNLLKKDLKGWENNFTRLTMGVAKDFDFVLTDFTTGIMIVSV